MWLCQPVPDLPSVKTSSTQSSRTSVPEDSQSRKFAIRDLEGYFGGPRTGRLYGIEKTLVWSIRRRKAYADVA